LFSIAGDKFFFRRISFLRWHGDLCDRSLGRFARLRLDVRNSRFDPQANGPTAWQIVLKDRGEIRGGPLGNVNLRLQIDRIAQGRRG
jgi:hypothetical protein